MDPAHRRHDNMLAAIAKSKLAWARDEVLATQTVGAAPFGTHGHHGVLAGAAEEFFGNFTYTCDLFQHFYPAICFQAYGGKHPPEYGFDSHMQLLWAMCEDFWGFASPGTRTKVGRWYQIFAKGAKLLPWWKLCEMILVYVGLHQGWLDDDSPEDRPALLSTLANMAATEASADAADAANVAPSSAAAPSAPADRSVARSNRFLDRMMNRCKNLLHVTYHIFRNDALRALWMLMQAATEPHKVAHGINLQMLDTRDGGLEWEWSMAEGQYTETLTSILLAISDPDLMIGAGLQAHSVRSTGNLLSAEVAQAFAGARVRFRCFERSTIKVTTFHIRLRCCVWGAIFLGSLSSPPGALIHVWGPVL